MAMSEPSDRSFSGSASAAPVASSPAATVPMQVLASRRRGLGMASPELS